MLMSCLDFKEFQPLYAYKLYAYKKKGVHCSTTFMEKQGIVSFYSFFFQYSQGMSQE